MNIRYECLLNFYSNAKTYTLCKWMYISSFSWTNPHSWSLLVMTSCAVIRVFLMVVHAFVIHDLTSYEHLYLWYHAWSYVSFVWLFTYLIQTISSLCSCSYTFLYGHSLHIILHVIDSYMCRLYGHQLVINVFSLVDV